ncbi:uncharacterized protein BYT42DRAFT_559587 [Radiomyces spectabilis]|uniref:uncharacterized protein n=1 Tax=Radiomyces spectabilis TaxID=64574 RepID=UPI00221FFD96|nr:uncharacterized protein BYT42DRAFT_559587 [Radiomyces spectabilis]KAI8388290.1 hypothetical protein BYT42DRAFT_559587 [Radiomyces spectabilis]
MIEGLNASSYNENDAISAQNLIESIDRALLQMPTHRNSAATTQPPNFTSALASIQLHPDMINAFINDPSIDLWNIPADSTTTNTPSDRLHETTTIKRKRAKSQSRHMKRSRFSSDMYTGMNPPATPSTCFRNSPTYSPSTMHPNLYHNNSQTQRSRDSRFQLVDLQTIAHAQEEYIQRKELLEARQQKYEQHTGWF